MTNYIVLDRQHRIIGTSTILDITMPQQDSIVEVSDTEFNKLTHNFFDFVYKNNEILYDPVVANISADIVLKKKNEV